LFAAATPVGKADGLGFIAYAYFAVGVNRMKLG
jgi:hypothetical protein